MISSNNRISIRQLQILFIMDIFGTGVVILPRVTANFASNDGWLLIIGAVLITTVYVYIINSLAEKFPRDSFVEYSKKIAGAPLGYILSFIFAARIIFMAGIELRIFGEIIRQTMLYSTPIQVTCGIMAMLAAYIAAKGFEVRARLAEMLIFIVLVPIILIFIIAAFDADFTNLLPAFKTPPTNIIMGSFYVSFAFRGAELALLVYPFVNKPLSIKKGQIKAVIFIGAIMLLTTVVTLAKFGAADARTQLWPVIQMMDTIDFPGKFFERQDAFMLSFWIISIFISLSAGIFFSSFIYARVFSAKTQNVYIIPCAVLIFSVSLLPKNIVETYRWLSFSDNTIGIAYLLFIPLALLIIAKLRKLGGDNNEMA